MRLVVFSANVLAMAALVTGCSSNQERGARGLLEVKLGASRSAARLRGASSQGHDPIAGILAAKVTIGAIEARRSEGNWAPFESGFPTDVELLALADDDGTVTLPTGPLPEGQYTALHVRIVQAELTPLSGTRVTLAPPGTGWVGLIPVDFGVVNGRETIVSLNVLLDSSFRFVGDHVEFEPELEVEGVEHD